MKPVIDTAIAAFAVATLVIVTTQEKPLKEAYTKIIQEVNQNGGR